ncbi:MAG: transcriptional repressor [Bacteroidales bacterium]|nr:transcriptional repressor [Bacteroidales bacterium]
MATENAYRRLLQYGIKPSLQRVAIMDYLLQHRTHPTVEDIYGKLSDEMPTLSKTTVYNTLRLLVENGAALQLTIDEKTQHFDGDISQHAHFKCLKCGKIYDLPAPAPKYLNIEGDGILQVTECQVYYKGYCPHCQGKQN